MRVDVDVDVDVRDEDGSFEVDDDVDADGGVNPAATADASDICCVVRAGGVIHMGRVGVACNSGRMLSLTDTNGICATLVACDA